MSIDEICGIQALERIAPSRPMRPGQVERREFEYRRHGTQTLIACFDVTTGHVQGSIGERRTEADFAAFLDDLRVRRARRSGGSCATTSTFICQKVWCAWWRSTVA